MAYATTQIGTPQRRKDGWLVPSASGTGTYYVEISGERVRCTCPQWVYAGRKRGVPCKHIRRARAMTKEVTMAD